MLTVASQHRYVCHSDSAMPFQHHDIGMYALPKVASQHYNAGTLTVASQRYDLGMYATLTVAPLVGGWEKRCSMTKSVH